MAAAVLNVVLGGDLGQHPDVAGDELALSSVAVGPSARGTAGVERMGALPEPPTLPHRSVSALVLIGVTPRRKATLHTSS